MPHTAIPTRDIFDAGHLGIRHETLRRTNEKAVLTVVGFNPNVSNAEISRLSGLSPQTVSAILATLEADGLIERRPVVRGRRGQPATPIGLNKTGAFAIGVEIGWRHLCVATVNFHGQVEAYRGAAHAFPDATTIFDTIAAMAGELLAELPEEHRTRLLDIGVAMPRDLAANLDLIGAPAGQIALWRNVDVIAELKARTGLEITTLNDGNCGLWAELIGLPRPRPANILYFLCSQRVAAAVIVNGKLIEGPAGGGANLGAMLLETDADGPLDVHAAASVAALSQVLAKAGKKPDLSNWQSWGEESPERNIWIKGAAKALARTAFNAMTVIESPLVVLDTVLDKAVTELLAEQFRVELAALPVRNFEPPGVIVGQFGRMAPTIGAAELPLFRRYF